MSVKNKESFISDSQFIEGIGLHSDEMLGKFYKLHYPMILQLVLMNNGSEQDAKDVYQEAIMILCEKINRGTFELNSKLKTFIYSVSRKIWLKKLKLQNRFSGRVIDFEEVFSITDDLEYHEKKEENYQAMAVALIKLGEPCKTIIEDFYMHSRSMADITEKFGYTNPDNAKTQKYKCMMRLKKLFFAQYIEEQ